MLMINNVIFCISFGFPDGNKMHPQKPKHVPWFSSTSHTDHYALFCAVENWCTPQEGFFFEKLPRDVLTPSTINCGSQREGKQPNIYHPHPSFKLTGGERLLPRKQRPWVENCIALNQRRLLWCSWTLDRMISRLWICCITLDLKPIKVHKNPMGPARAACTVA